MKTSIQDLWSPCGSKGIGHYRSLPGALVLVLCCMFTRPVRAAVGFSLLYTFQCGADGALPEAGLILDTAGNLYGTTSLGGEYGLGTVFEISPDGQETVLHSFAGGTTDGWDPIASLIRDADGNLYGTTTSGGTYGEGTVFEISNTGVEIVLYSFSSNGSDGKNPFAGLVRDGAGNLYGTTYDGGLDGYGTVFEVSPQGMETVLYSFTGGADGGNPFGGLLIVSGNLYGTTQHGGASGAGVVFEISKSKIEAVLHSFDGSDGYAPEAGLVTDSAGNLYGTTHNGGAFDVGNVFKIDPAGNESAIYSFYAFPLNDNSGYDPIGGLFRDARGDLFGTTPSGGHDGLTCNGSLGGCGVVFMVSPEGEETVLHTFRQHATGGIDPVGAVVGDSAHNLYGATFSGGTYNCGTVYKLAP